MITVTDIMDFMETVAPADLKMDWDNVGLNCGSRAAPVTKILIALDPFDHVCQEAVDIGANLLLTHHPLIFRPLSTVTDDTATSRGLMKLVRHGISHFCAHTNLDCATGGINDALAVALGLSSITTVPTDKHSLLRKGVVPEQVLSDFLPIVKANLHCDGLRYCNSGKAVHTVAVGGGACADALQEVFAAGCDTFVTADVKYNQFWDAKELGINLIDAGHFATENLICSVLAEKLQAAFPEIQVLLSKKHTDCMKFY